MKMVLMKVVFAASNTTKSPREDPERQKKMEAGEETKARNFGRSSGGGVRRRRGVRRREGGVWRREGRVSGGGRGPGERPNLGRTHENLDHTQHRHTTPQHNTQHNKTQQRNAATTTHQTTQRWVPHKGVLGWGRGSCREVLGGAGRSMAQKNKS